MMGAAEISIRRDLGRGSEIERTANRLGPIYYELRRERAAKRRERIQRWSAAVVNQVNAVRALLSPAYRVRCQVDCTGAR